MCENNPWYEYSIAEMVLEESTHTVLSDARECKGSFKLACRYKEQAEENLARSDSSRAAS